MSQLNGIVFGLHHKIVPQQISFGILIVPHEFIHLNKLSFIAS
jgi:hypothetical protein